MRVQQLWKGEQLVVLINRLWEIHCKNVHGLQILQFYSKIVHLLKIIALNLVFQREQHKLLMLHSGLNQRLFQLKFLTQTGVLIQPKLF